MKSFQTIILVVFIVFIALAVIIFSTSSGGGVDDSEVNITIWGTIDSQKFNEVVRTLALEKDDFPRVSYVEKEPQSYVSNIIEATAKGEAPDIFLVSDENLFKLRDLIIKVPFSSYSERVFRDTYLEAGEVFIENGGIMAFPIFVDPMVMYWNRDLYQSYGLSEAPEYWDEFFTIAPRITETDEALNINKSAVALGEYDNIRHSREILSGIILQSGNPIISRNQSGNLISTLGGSDNKRATESALRFYTEFANPSKSVYSWNKSLPEAQESFLSEDLATYFGFSSELELLRARNPNLDFDVTTMPQIRDFDKRAVFGRIIGLAVSKNTQNTATVFRLLGSLTARDFITEFSRTFNMPPVRRDLLGQSSERAFEEVFRESALITESYQLPDEKETEGVFEEMIESVVSGRNRISEAVNRAHDNFNRLFVDNQ